NKLQENTGADAVLYITVEEWGQKYEIIQSRTVVKSDWKLVDARNGNVLWEASAFGQRTSSVGGGGAIGALVGALIEQLAGSLVDYTPQVSTLANTTTVSSKNTGLLPGPYCLTNEHVPTCKPLTE